MNRLVRGLLLSIIAHMIAIGMVCLLMGAGRSEDNLVEIDLAAVGFNDGKGGGGMSGGGSGENGRVPVMDESNDGKESAASLSDRQARHQVSSPQVEKNPPDTVQSQGNRVDSSGVSTSYGGMEDGTVPGSGKGTGTGIGDDAGPGRGTGAGLGRGMGSGIGSGSGTGDGSGSGRGDGVGRYISANYNYILAHIQRQLVYPSQARMMGISGKAVYSFVIRQDGHIDSLSLVSSAGFDPLDAAGLKAIRKASPFPAPPAPARIRVPVVFSLR
ncbi:MAG: energy transducer TonB [Oxalobacter sp.]